jgi:putative SOS response-associated peptidase YedK
VLQDLFGLQDLPDLSPRYNIAPTQKVAAVRPAVQGGRELVLLRWGLIPSWAGDPSIGSRLLNARAETVAEKPSFRSALQRRRCLIAADGFFEWQAQKGKKQPYYFRLADGRPFAFAGLWERWSRGGGEPLETCTIITTEANDLVRSYHERMPVILPTAAHAAWLDTSLHRPEPLLPLLCPYPGEEMAAYPVNPLVNSPRTDDARCIERVA